MGGNVLVEDVTELVSMDTAFHYGMCGYQAVDDGGNQSGQRSLRSLKNLGREPDGATQDPPENQPDTERGGSETS